MNRKTKLSIFAITIAAGSLLCAGEASAWGWGGSGGCWGGHRSFGSYGSFGSRGSYGSYGSLGSRGSYGSYGSRGSHGSYGSRGSYGSYGSRGSHGSYGSYGSRGSHGSYGSDGSYGSYGSYGRSWYRGGYGRYYAASGYGRHSGYGGTTVRRVVRNVAIEPNAIGSSTNLRNQTTARAALDVNVPENAVVYVNGVRTKSKGRHRVFLSSPMNDGEATRFAVRAVVEENGQTNEETKVVTVSPRQTEKLSFDLGLPEPVQTTLILNVPNDAIVQIEGHEVTQTGPRRIVSTRLLAMGKSLDDLTVRVTLDRHGRTISKEQKTALRGGAEQELTFEFDDAALAQR